MSEAVEEKAANEIRRHCELLVEDLEVARCEQTMALAEAEGASVAWRSEGEGPDEFGLEHPQVWSGSVLPAVVVGRFGCVAAGGKGSRATPCASESGAQGLWPGTAALQVTVRACRMCFCSACASRGGSAPEPENPEVRGGVGIANQSGSIVSSHKFTTSSSSYSSSIAEQDHNTSKKLLDPIEPL
jgi:hypothetical protein